MSDEPTGEVERGGKPASRRGRKSKVAAKPEAVLYRAEAPAGVITLNRADRRNAISSEIVGGLHAALDRALDDEAVRAVILTGAGTSFSSGVDLHEAADQVDRPYEENLAEADALARLYRRLRSFEKVTIAAVNGPALASGCCLATLCDYTVAAATARLGFPEVRAGFVPAIVAVFLRNLVGEKRARDLLLTGRVLSADDALEYGLVNEVVPADQLMESGRRIARLIAESPATSIRFTKELLETLPDLDLDRGLKAAVESNARMRSSEEFREGVRAFLEKRDPWWVRPEETPQEPAPETPAGS